MVRILLRFQIELIYNLKIISFLLAIFISTYANTQKVYGGVKYGLLTKSFYAYENYNNQNFVNLIGLNVEYRPLKANFNFSGELQYLIEPKMLLVPLSVNLIIGKEKLKFRPNIGIIPIVRFQKTNLNHTLSFGAKSGLGLEYQVNEKISVIGDLGLMLIPYRTAFYEVYGGSSVQLDIVKCMYVNVGVNYLIKLKSKISQP